MTPIPDFDPQTIYADYQATTPVDPRVERRMRPYWREKFGNPHSADHAVGWQADEAVRESSESVARLLGVDTDEIIFTSGATEANNLALIGLARAALGPRRRILVSAIEHKSVLAAADFVNQNFGFQVELLPVESDGKINLAVLEELADSRVLVASINAVNNEIGTVQDFATISALLRRHGIWLHTDAAQSPCALDVAELTRYVDLLSLSSHKIYGPPGIGALYLRRELHHKLEPVIVGGGQQSNLRSGTIPMPLCVGFGAACELMNSPGASEERSRVAICRDKFVDLVAKGAVPICVNGPMGSDRHPGNANLQFCGLDAHDVLGSIQPKIAASTGSACTSGATEESHVLSAIGLSEAASKCSVRFSFGRFTSFEEVSLAARYVNKATMSLMRNV